MTLPPPETEHALELHLRVPAPGDVRVDRAVALRRDFRHELTFGRRDALRDVLSPALAVAVEEIVAGAGGPDDGVHALPGLLLARPTVDRGGAAATAVRVRFGTFIGGLQAAFAMPTYLDNPTLEHREAIGVSTLSDVTMPLLNLAHVAAAIGAPRGAFDVAPDEDSAAMSRRVAEQMRAVEERARDLEFYAGLLRRYVADCAPRRPPMG